MAKTVKELEAELAQAQEMATSLAQENAELKKGGAKETPQVTFKKKVCLILEPHFTAILKGKVKTVLAKNLGEAENADMVEYLLENSPESLQEVA